MIKTIKSKLKRYLRLNLGRDIIPFDISFSSLARLQRSLETNQINCVVDVGANIGKYAMDLITYGYKKKIISFEPISSLHQELQQLASSHSHWVIAPRCALGSVEGEETLNVTKDLSSSSLLQPVNETERTQITRQEKCPVLRLDQALLPHLESSSRVFLKLDVQGFEDRVLAGCTGIWNHVVGIQIELSFSIQYENQVPYRQILDRLTDDGFQLWSIDPVLVDNSGRMLQCDAILFR